LVKKISKIVEDLYQNEYYYDSICVEVRFTLVFSGFFAIKEFFILIKIERAIFSEFKKRLFYSYALSIEHNVKMFGFLVYITDTLVGSIPNL